MVVVFGVRSHRRRLWASAWPPHSRSGCSCANDGAAAAASRL